MNHVKTFAIAIALLGVTGCAKDSTDSPQRPPFLQGFEVDTSGWTTTQGITRVASNGGTLGIPASAGTHYAEIQIQADGYATGYGDGGHSFYGGKGTTYEGDFYQAIDVYVDATWSPAAAAGVPSFWIDMTPYHADPANYGAEHNFRLTATGSAVDVAVDGQASPIASLTTSGWYTFLMTFRKGATATTPVLTDLVIRNAQKKVIGQATAAATSPGGPFNSQDLAGNGYVWITVWQNGFAGNLLAIDNLETGLLPY